MVTTRIAVSRPIAAPPEAIWAVLASPAGHVAIDASGMLQSADGPSVTAVGDEFVVHMDRESLGDRPMGKYDVTVTITALDAPRHLEWTVSAFGRTIGHLYGYELAPDEAGTLVTSYCDWSALGPEVLEHVTFPIVPETSLKATLGILARTVERP